MDILQMQDLHSKTVVTSLLGSTSTVPVQTHSNHSEKLSFSQNHLKIHIFPHDTDAWE